MTYLLVAHVRECAHICHAVTGPFIIQFTDTFTLLQTDTVSRDMQSKDQHLQLFQQQVIQYQYIHSNIIAIVVTLKISIVERILTMNNLDNLNETKYSEYISE